jgi:folate-binding protein YgfZ
MEPLLLHGWHQSHHATFMEVHGQEVVRGYGALETEHTALGHTAALIDLGYRGRLCLTGADRARYLNGQVTNHVSTLKPGQGCYAALVTAKGRMESDLHIHCLQDEFLLDFEPGRVQPVTDRLEKYVVADEVEVIDIAASYGLLTLQGPNANQILDTMALSERLPTQPYESITLTHADMGEAVLVCLPRFGTRGFDLFIPRASLQKMAERLRRRIREAGGCLCGWDAMEMARIEAGIPRFGQDMDETIIPLEAGLEERAVRYDKGCYIGQEVINRIHSIGHVNKCLRGLRLPPDLGELPAKGDPLLHHGKAMGFVTSAVRSLTLNQNLALGYVRREVDQPNRSLTLATRSGELPVTVLPLPFVPAEP